MIPQIRPIITINNIIDKRFPVEYAMALSEFANAFWDNGGKEKYESTKEARDANGIPDSQWFKANLMGIIDDAEITYDNGINQSK